jgi:hypothetical protein
LIIQVIFFGTCCVEGHSNQRSAKPLWVRGHCLASLYIRLIFNACLEIRIGLGAPSLNIFKQIRCSILLWMLPIRSQDRRDAHNQPNPSVDTQQDPPCWC